MGAEVHVYADWQGFAVQRNRQIAHTRCDWVLFLDADEVIPPELAEEIRSVVARNESRVYDVTWLQMAFGRPLTHMRRGEGLPRLFPMRELISFEGVVHEGAQLRHPDTPHTTLEHRLEHFSRRTIHQSLLKLAQYAQLGAVKRAAAGKRGGVLRGLGSGGQFCAPVCISPGGFVRDRRFLHCFLVALESFFRYAALEVDGDHLKKAVLR